jgi:pyruvate dehydrogenase E2 component (dihydrolipoamide acetyltransferase)
MPSTIVMPKTGADATEGKLVRWLKQAGDKVSIGDVVAEIETEKVNMEVESFSSGVLHELLAPEGATLPVGTPIAVVLKDGEAPPALSAAPSGAPPAETAPAPAPMGASPSSAMTTASAERVMPSGQATDGRIKASPIARRLAQEFNLNLAAIPGRGPAGRIVKADVEAAIEAGRGTLVSAAPPASQPAMPPALAQVPAAVAPAASAEPGEQPEGVTIRELTRMQLTTGRRLSESKQQAPHFYITVDVDMAEALKLRALLNEQAAGAFKISVNDLVIKATAWALGQHPRLNASFRDGKLYQYDHVHMSVAMAVEEGLVSPVLRDVDRKSLGQIARESRALIERARAGKLRPDDFAEGTFTVSNLGMYNVDTFVAIINPPQAAILAVGVVSEVPVVRQGQIVVGQIMKATISVDHRAADGAQAAQFLAEVRRALENPLLMAL